MLIKIFTIFPKRVSQFQIHLFMCQSAWFLYMQTHPLSPFSCLWVIFHIPGQILYLSWSHPLLFLLHNNFSVFWTITALLVWGDTHNVILKLANNHTKLFSSVLVVLNHTCAVETEPYISLVSLRKCSRLETDFSGKNSKSRVRRPGCSPLKIV